MANRVELRRDLCRTHRAGNARPRCPGTAVAACGLRAGRGRHDDAALFHHRLAWLNGVADRYVVFDGGHIVQDYEADEFLSLSPGCVAAMGLRAFDLEPYRHRIAALASSPAAESGSTDNASLAIEWFAEDDTSLDTYEYAIDHVIEHGLEGSPTFVLRTADPAAEDSPFRWLLAINPLPSRKAFAEGGLLSHLHFQYANDLHTLVATDGPPAPRPCAIRVGMPPCAPTREPPRTVAPSSVRCTTCSRSGNIRRYDGSPLVKQQRFSSRASADTRHRSRNNGRSRATRFCGSIGAARPVSSIRVHAVP